MTGRGDRGAVEESATGLEGRGAVVTGGGGGIGAAVAHALARRGAAVAVASRGIERIEAVAADLRQSGARALAISCDVTEPDSVAAMAETAAGRLGTVDILVHCAGSGASGGLREQTLDGWNRTLAVHATGAMLCSRALAAGMAERGFGRLVYLSSVAGLRGEAGLLAYSAAQHAIVGLSRALAIELAGRGVTVNAVCPSYVDTAATAAAVRALSRSLGVSEARALESVLAPTPQRRLLAPAEVAEAVAWLCSAAAAGVSGQPVVIDGGEITSLVAGVSSEPM